MGCDLARSWLMRPLESVLHFRAACLRNPHNVPYVRKIESAVRLCGCICRSHAVLELFLNEDLPLADLQTVALRNNPAEILESGVVGLINTFCLNPGTSLQVATKRFFPGSCCLRRVRACVHVCVITAVPAGTVICRSADGRLVIKPLPDTILCRPSHGLSTCVPDMSGRQ